MNFFQVLMSNMSREQLLMVMGRVADQFPRELESCLIMMPPDVNPKKPDWCVCHRCTEVEDARMRVCCRQQPCITQHPTFSRICLAPAVILICGILDYCDQFHDEPTFEPSHWRNRSYRFFILWMYGKLGHRTRRCPPACVITRIRHQFPNTDEQPYTGYESQEEFDYNDLD